MFGTYTIFLFKRSPETHCCEASASLKGHLQTIIDNLPKDKLYFTVVQHDDGIMIRIPNNVIVFGMGGIGNVPLPLTYDNTDLFEIHKNNPKTVFCSFVGSLTHQCRVIMVSAMNKPDVVMITDNWTFQIKEDKQQLFLDITSKSRFTLAPRGYGKTSFRMYEALRLNSIPVYIYDDAWLPYKEVLDWSKLAVLVHIDDIDTLYNRISDEQITEMLDYYHSVEHYFTYEGMCEYVLDKSKNYFLCTKINTMYQHVDERTGSCVRSSVAWKDHLKLNTDCIKIS